jgi:hypothetical protein
MKNAWKWILGVLLVLLVVAALVAVPFAMRSYMAANPGVLAQGRVFNGGPMMRGNNGQQGNQPGFGFNGQRGPMMGGRGFERGFSRFGGFGPFGFGLMFLGGLLRLIPLALFGLLLYGVYQLGKRAGVRSVMIPAPAATPPAAASEEQPVG